MTFGFRALAACVMLAGCTRPNPAFGVDDGEEGKAASTEAPGGPSLSASDGEGDFDADASASTDDGNSTEEGSTSTEASTDDGAGDDDRLVHVFAGPVISGGLEVNVYTGFDAAVILCNDARAELGIACVETVPLIAFSQYPNLEILLAKIGARAHEEVVGNHGYRLAPTVSQFLEQSLELTLETARVLEGVDAFWTGFASVEGDELLNCNDWASFDGVGTVGSIFVKEDWLAVDTAACWQDMHYLCACR